MVESSRVDGELLDVQFIQAREGIPKRGQIPGGVRLKWGEDTARGGQKWGKSGAKVGQKWDKSGAKLGQNWGQKQGRALDIA